MCCFKQTLKYILKSKNEITIYKKPVTASSFFFVSIFFLSKFKIYVSNIFNLKKINTVQIQENATFVSASHLECLLILISLSKTFKVKVKDKSFLSLLDLPYCARCTHAVQNRYLWGHRVFLYSHYQNRLGKCYRNGVIFLQR